MAVFKLTLCVVLIYIVETNGSVLKETTDVLKSPTELANRIHNYILQKNELSEQCSQHLVQYTTELLQIKSWALRMFDASAKVPSGILDGNLADLGSFDECINIIEITKKYTITGKYCIANLPINRLQILPSNLTGNFIQAILPQTKEALPTNDTMSLYMQLAVCFPSICSAKEILEVYNSIGVGVNIDERYCQTKDSQPQLDVGAIISLSFFAVVLWLLVTSTVYDYFLQQYNKVPVHSLFIAFSVLTNGRKLSSTTKNSDEITCLNGIRVISMLWIILGHSYIFQAVMPMRNSIFLVEWLAGHYSMLIVGATLAVDTFLLVGGLMISYIFMTCSSRGVKFNILLFYFHRYLRLTPALATVILFHVYLIRYMGSGPLWPTLVDNVLINPCKVNWWKTLLYIQNYQSDLLLCMPQTWYLSVDSQLYLVSPLILLPLKRWPKIILFLTGFLCLCCIVVCFAVSWILQLNPSVVGTNGFQEYMKNYYTATHTRAAPWLLGIILGYFIFITKQRNCKMVINKVIVLVFWIIAIIVLLVCVFSGFELIHGQYKRLDTAFYNGLIRSVWAIAVAWIIYACQFGYGGIVNLFLSMPVFKVLSRLTYSCYLTHILIIFITTVNMKTPPVVSDAMMLEYIWTTYILTLFVSTLLSLGFESPIIAIEKVLLGRPQRKKSGIESN